VTYLKEITHIYSKELSVYEYTMVVYIHILATAVQRQYQASGEIEWRRPRERYHLPS
jgi:hypothetical protein